jgi:hypothetical protein
MKYFTFFQDAILEYFDSRLHAGKLKHFIGTPLYMLNNYNTFTATSFQIANRRTRISYGPFVGFGEYFYFGYTLDQVLEL